METTMRAYTTASEAKRAGVGPGRDGRDASRSGIRLLERACQPERRLGTAFVLSGGGARGAMQVGAMRALLEYGVRPDAVVGTSSGAWNAAWIARNPTLAGVRALEAAWRALRPTRTLLGQAVASRCPRWAQSLLLKLASARRLLSGAPSLYDNAGMSECLHREFAGQTFETMALPLRIIATDLTHARAAVLESGPVAPAVLASCAIPGLFPPVRIGNALYTDGMFVDNCSVETAQHLGARCIFVLAIGNDTELDGGALWAEPGASGDKLAPAATPSVAAAIGRATQVMGHVRLERQLAQVPADVEVHVISLSNPGGAGCLDFDHVSDWVELGYAITREYLLAHVPGQASAPAA